jgi:hypothetical protein
MSSAQPLAVMSHQRLWALNDSARSGAVMRQDVDALSAAFSARRRSISAWRESLAENGAVVVGSDPSSGPGCVGMVSRQPGQKVSIAAWSLK